MELKTKCLKKQDNGYQVAVEDMVVEMEYSSNNKKIEDYMINILKQKIKTS